MQAIALGVQRERDYQNLPCATSKKFLVPLNAQKTRFKAAGLSLLLFAWKAEYFI